MFTCQLRLTNVVYFRNNYLRQRRQTFLSVLSCFVCLSILLKNLWMNFRYLEAFGQETMEILRVIWRLEPTDLIIFLHCLSVICEIAQLNLCSLQVSALVSTTLVLTAPDSNIVY